MIVYSVLSGTLRDFINDPSNFNPQESQFLYLSSRKLSEPFLFISSNLEPKESGLFKLLSGAKRTHFYLLLSGAERFFILSGVLRKLCYLSYLESTLRTFIVLSIISGALRPFIVKFSYL